MRLRLRWCAVTLLTAAVLPLCSSQPTCGHGERAALEMLYLETTNNFTVPWDVPWALAAPSATASRFKLAGDPCFDGWQGVGCDGFGHIEALELQHNHLAGTLPAAALSLLTHLRVLNLANNLLFGTLPPTISLLTALRTLDVSNNRLTGVVPSMAKMEFLERLHLHANTDLTGTVPTDLGIGEHLHVTTSGTQITVRHPKGYSEL